MTATDEATTGPDGDGRHARSRRSREAVLDAFLDEVVEQGTWPSVDAVAARAGVSPRSVFRHFGDLAGLVDAAITRQVERLVPLAELPAHDPSLAGRIDALVASRAVLHEAATPIQRVVQLARRSAPGLDQQLRVGGDLSRAQVEWLFAPELDALEPVERQERIAALDLATSWLAWSQLRDSQRLDVDASAAAIRRLVTGILR